MTGTGRRQACGAREYRHACERTGVPFPRIVETRDLSPIKED
jgi:hypothetical protein